jgi:hypothetical protein
LHKKEITCQVESFQGDNLLFVKPKTDNKHCPYWIFFGNKCVCRCPIRLDLYKLREI